MDNFEEFDTYLVHQIDKKLGTQECGKLFASLLKKDDCFVLWLKVLLILTSKHPALLYNVIFTHDIVDAFTQIVNQKEDSDEYVSNNYYTLFLRLKNAQLDEEESFIHIVSDLMKVYKQRGDTEEMELRLNALSHCDTLTPQLINMLFYDFNVTKGETEYCKLLRQWLMSDSVRLKICKDERSVTQLMKSVQDIITLQTDSINEWIKIFDKYVHTVNDENIHNWCRDIVKTWLHDNFGNEEALKHLAQIFVYLLQHLETQHYVVNQPTQIKNWCLRNWRNSPTATRMVILALFGIDDGDAIEERLVTVKINYNGDTPMKKHQLVLHNISNRQSVLSVAKQLIFPQGINQNEERQIIVNVLQSCLSEKLWIFDTIANFIELRQLLPDMQGVHHIQVNVVQKRQDLWFGDKICVHNGLELYSKLVNNHKSHHYFDILTLGLMDWFIKESESIKIESIFQALFVLHLLEIENIFKKHAQVCILYFIFCILYFIFYILYFILQYARLMDQVLIQVQQQLNQEIIEPKLLKLLYRLFLNHLFKSQTKWIMRHQNELVKVLILLLQHIEKSFGIEVRY